VLFVLSPWPGLSIAEVSRLGFLSLLDIIRDFERNEPSILAAIPGRLERLSWLIKAMGLRVFSAERFLDG
jgi:hypothetical protein